MRLQQEQNWVQRITSHLANICTCSLSLPFLSLPYSLVPPAMLFIECGEPFSVISANASAADLCKSTLSEYARVDSARKGWPSKKFVWLRSIFIHNNNQKVNRPSIQHVSGMYLFDAWNVSRVWFTYFPNTEVALLWHLVHYPVRAVHTTLSDCVLEKSRSATLSENCSFKR